MVEKSRIKKRKQSSEEKGEKKKGREGVRREEKEGVGNGREGREEKRKEMEELRKQERREERKGRKGGSQVQEVDNYLRGLTFVLPVFPAPRTSPRANTARRNTTHSAQLKTTHREHGIESTVLKQHSTALNTHTN